MKIGKLVACTALVSGLAATVPAPASAQVGGLIKKKVQGTVAQTVAGSNAAAASPAAQAAPGPVFTENVLEITPELLDRLENALAAEAAAREENALRLGNVLSAEEYDRCKVRVLTSPEGQRLSEESVRLIGDATTQEQMERAMQEMATRLEALVEPECGLEPGEAEQLRGELALRVVTAGEEAAGLTKYQLSILKERILPLCAAPEAAAAELRIPTEKSTIFYVYSPTEVEALQPRCPSLVEALQADG